jgi:hypothetical protein
VGVRKTTKRHDSRSQERDLNPGPPKHRARVLTCCDRDVRPTCICVQASEAPVYQTSLAVACRLTVLRCEDLGCCVLPDDDSYYYVSLSVRVIGRALVTWPSSCHGTGNHIRYILVLDISKATSLDMNVATAVCVTKYKQDSISSLQTMRGTTLLFVTSSKMLSFIL